MLQQEWLLNYNKQIENEKEGRYKNAVIDSVVLN